MRRIPNNRDVDNKIVKDHEEWRVIRRTEVTIETHTVTTVRRQPCEDTKIVTSRPDLDVDVSIVAASGEPSTQYKWRRS